MKSADPRILRGMLDLFRDGHGWCKGAMHQSSTSNPRWCLVGAYNKVTCGHQENWYGFNRDKQPELGLVLDVITEQYPDYFDGCTSIVEFNDFHKTRWNDVERVMEKAIVQAEELT